ncbi:rho GTPase-activating protein 39-like [Centruroides sculpturatus]|uniref:rho GTPase-activating protein 39-like n=1 Tax=Centruroides sculpturatus TaxID=218467 RepID=UPI000C6D2ABB|nr:rho GTPase-activating protein 39-like [Centruroides sculpturatus]
MSSDRVEWVEIIEPRTNEHIYANLTTGECVWDVPPGVKVKKTDDNQWWELFDQNTSRFYYYNATSQKTVWHRPQNCDIIPLAKLQTLKQNTEVQDDDGCKSVVKKESVATQTSSKGLDGHVIIGRVNNTSCASTQTSPVSSPHQHCKRHHHHQKQQSSSPPSPPNVLSPKHFMEENINNEPQAKRDNQFSRESRNAPVSRSQDSGRSSDSSCLSQGPSFESQNHPGHRKHDSCCSSESTGSGNHQSLLPENLDFSPVQNGLTFDIRSSSKQTISNDLNRHHPEYDHHPDFGSRRQYSVDSATRISRSNSSKIFRDGIGYSPSLQSMECTPKSHRKHEDYNVQNNFNVPSHHNKSSDNRYPPDGLCTPLTSRRNWSRTGSRSTDSSMSSPQSPLVPNTDVQVIRSVDGSLLTFNDIQGVHHGRGSSDSSPHSMDSSGRGVDSGLLSQESHMSLDSQQKSTSEPPTSPNLRTGHRYSKSPLEKEGTKLRTSHSREGSEISLGSYFFSALCNESQKTSASPQLNEQPTPLYSNLDYPSLWDRKSDNQSYLLPLQHYLLEQAKLSGYRLGDFMGDDLDSLSQSEEESDGCRDDEDDFADDEAMSHQDSSSQEYLDDTRFLDEDDDDQIYCEPPSTLQQRNKASQLSATQHASLRRKHINTTPVHSPVLEKSQSFQPDMGQGMGQRPLSMLTSSITDSSVTTNPMTGSLQRQTIGIMTNTLYKDKKPPSESDIEKYAEDNLNRHKKGIFRKKFTIRDMLSWSKDPIRKPMIMTTDKSLKRDACELFKLIQTYMCDRKPKSGQSMEQVALDIATRGWSKQALRDELYVQICRQTTDNPRRDSVILGWELMAVCLSFFPPSVKFQPYLESYINRHKDNTLDTSELKISPYAAVCSKRLERMARTGAKKGLRKPTLEEIDQSRIQIFRPSMFGNTLEEVMALQKIKYHDRRLPWIQTALSEAVLRLNGAQTEGIFRVPGDIDEVNAMKLRIDQWEIVESTDPHVPASLLKLWYRELYEPLIPNQFYNECIEYCNDGEAAVQIVQKLPEINRLVLSYLIRFLQVNQNTFILSPFKSNYYF